MKFYPFYIFSILILIRLSLFAQPGYDSSILLGKKIVTLSEVVVKKGLDVPYFINRIQNDSSFYKAFRNLHILTFTAINDIRMLDRKGNLEASLRSTTRQSRTAGCRTMEVVSEIATGDMYDNKHEYNYYTADMYAVLFFTKGKICGENNIVSGRELSIGNKFGIEKHKEQLKMLFFNPGKKITGLPFMSSKTEIFSDNLTTLYDLSIDAEMFNGIYCFVFTQKIKPGNEDKAIIDEMKTWFNDSTFDVVARDYSLSYDAGVFDYKVNMKVEMSQFYGLTVPVMVRYNGNWKAIFKKRERGVFTATLFDFSD